MTPMACDGGLLRPPWKCWKRWKRHTLFFSSLASNFQPCQQFPALPAISSLASNFLPCQQFPALPAISCLASNFLPGQQFPALPDVAAHRHRLPVRAAPKRVARASRLAKIPSFASLYQCLESESFAEREKASHDLNELATVAAPRLRHLPSGASAEARRRAKAVLDKIDAISASSAPEGRIEDDFLAAKELVRASRAVTALEMAGTPDAGEALTALPKEGPTSWLGEQARASLDRLAKRFVAMP